MTKHPILTCLFMLFGLTRSIDSQKTYKNAVLIKSNFRTNWPQPECRQAHDGPSSCTVNCRGRNFCRDAFKIGEILCPTASPYCDPETLTCVSTIQNCRINNSTLKTALEDPPCTEDLSPNLLNCNAFKSCEYQTQRHYLCLDNRVFDPTTNECSKTTPCYTYTNETLCKDKTNQTVPYKFDRKKYVFCSPDNNPIILTCKRWEVFNPSYQKCQYRCQKLGLQPDPYDPRAFYNCSREKFGILARRGVCSEGLFDGNTKSCVKKTEHPEINRPEIETVGNQPGEGTGSISTENPSGNQDQSVNPPGSPGTSESPEKIHNQSMNPLDAAGNLVGSGAKPVENPSGTQGQSITPVETPGSSIETPGTEGNPEKIQSQLINQVDGPENLVGGGAKPVENPSGTQGLSITPVETPKNSTETTGSETKPEKSQSQSINPSNEANNPNGNGSKPSENPSGMQGPLINQVDGTGNPPESGENEAKPLGIQTPGMENPGNSIETVGNEGKPEKIQSQSMNQTNEAGNPNGNGVKPSENPSEIQGQLSNQVDDAGNVVQSGGNAEKPSENSLGTQNQSVNQVGNAGNEAKPEENLSETQNHLVNQMETEGNAMDNTRNETKQEEQPLDTPDETTARTEPSETDAPPEDAATTETDKLGNLVGSAGNFVGNAVNFAGSAVELVGSTGNLLNSTGSLAGSVGTFAESTGNLVGNVGNFIGSLQNFAENLQGNQKQNQPQDILGLVGSVTGVNPSLVGSAINLVNSTGNLVGSFANFTNSTGSLAGNAESFVGNVGGLIGSAGNLIGSTGSLVGSTGDLLGSTANLIGIGGNSGSAMTETAQRDENVEDSNVVGISGDFNQNVGHEFGVDAIRLGSGSNRPGISTPQSESHQEAPSKLEAINFQVHRPSFGSLITSGNISTPYYAIRRNDHLPTKSNIHPNKIQTNSPVSGTDDPIRVEVTSCGFPHDSTTGVLRKCQLQTYSTIRETFFQEHFVERIAIACFVDSERFRTVYYDCGEDVGVLDDCDRFGTKTGIVQDCTVGPCVQLSTNRTLISYDCRN